MSLIKCRECGRSISEYAKSCPNCGYARKHMRSHSNTNYSKRYIRGRKNGFKKQYIYYFLATVAAFSLFFLINGVFMESHGLPASNNISGISTSGYAETPSSIITQNNGTENKLFTIENVEITAITDNQLWREIEFKFDFYGSPNADTYRDGTGKLIVEVFAESYKSDSSIDVSQTYTVNITENNRYSGSIISFDTELVKERILSITFGIFGSFDSNNSVVVNLQ